MKDRKYAFDKLVDKVIVKTDDLGTTITVWLEDTICRKSFCFEWDLRNPIYSNEFEKFITTVCSVVEIAMIPKGDVANGNFDLAVGNANTSSYFWAASKEPYRESRFLTSYEESELLSENYQRMSFAKLDGKAIVKTDDSGTTIIVPFRNEFSEYRYCFEWNLNDQMDSKEFEKFLTVVLSSIEITMIPKGNVANDDYDLAVGNTDTKLFFLAASEEPYKESRFLTDEEVSELLREL